MSVTNKRVYLTDRPDGLPATSDFGFEEVAIGELAEDHVLVRVDTLSIDAFIRTTLDQTSFHDTAALGGTITALGVGEVIESNFKGLQAGDWVNGPLLAQTHAAIPGAVFQKIEPSSNIPPSTYLGILGLTTGITAWVGMIHVGAASEGETVVVSGAAGAVGMVAAQLAKSRGATVIGIAGGPEKCRFLVDEIGLDGAIDYKNDDINAQLKILAPNGIELFFDNVGGELLDTVLDNLASEGRIILCGAISQYQHMTDVRGPKLYLRLAERNAVMRGFTVDHYPQVFEQANTDLATLLVDGQMKLPEHVVSGIEQFPDALITLFTGGHTGKLLVKP
jgi:NADPH-dependent curcumin reductase CurA